MLSISRELVNSIVDAIVTSVDTREVLANTTELLGQAFGVSRCVFVTYNASRNESGPSPVEWCEDIPDPDKDLASITLARVIQSQGLSQPRPLVFSDVFAADSLSLVREELDLLGVRALVAVTTRFRGVPNGTIILYNAGLPREWSAELISSLAEIAYFCGTTLHHTQRSEELQASESFTREVLAGSQSSIAFFDVQGCVTYVNPTFERITGYTLAQARGEHFEQLIDAIVLPDDQQLVLERYRHCYSAHQGLGSISYRLSTKSPKQHWLVDQFGPVFSDSGILLGFESVAVDNSINRLSEERLRESESRYRRLVEHSDAIIFHTNRDHQINFVSRRALDFFGVSPEDFVLRESVAWTDLVHGEDRERMQLRAREMQSSTASFDEEFRVVNRVTGQSRWLLTRFMPVRNKLGELAGWDGFGVDITTRKMALEALELQSKKVRALYTVSSAIRGFLDPANIAQSGLQALCDATGADAGVCYLFSNKAGGELSLVAQHGFSPRFADRVPSLHHSPQLSTYVARRGQPVVVPDIRTDPRSTRALYEEEGMLSELLVPISVEDETLGTIGLFSRKTSRFDTGDVMLVSAAANQIGLAARQASLFSAYRRQTKNLAALYRISHELSRNLSLDDIFLQAFTIIRDELGLKRLWLGLLNESGTRIIGQAAYGPGLRRRLAEINVEIDDKENPIARVVRTREPIAIDNSNSVLKEFGVKRIFSRLAIHSIVLVPLISGGQVLGVLAVQPSSDDAPLNEEGIGLLRSLANEIAGVLLAKRFEDRIAEGEKMRTAGLLAAGIAHNFNNLLQAILGQASLLEMQAGEEPKMRRASQLITEAATKGAALVKQLMSFAHLEKPHRETVDLEHLITVSLESIRGMFPAKREFAINLGRELPRVYIDPAQIRQVITNLLVNSQEATAEGGVIEISSDYIVIDHRSPHYEVPFGRYLRVIIKDSGMGMDDETKKRCFEPFFTTKNVDPVSGLSMSGAGLGLAAAYALARRNGGSLVVESRVGQGTSFTLYVPVAELPRGANPPGAELNGQEHLIAGEDLDQAIDEVELGDKPTNLSNKIETLFEDQSAGSRGREVTGNKTSTSTSRIGTAREEG